MVVGIAAAELNRVHERIAGRFARAEPRARAREYLAGLVAGLERKNGWTLAERAGEVSPDGMQRLLRHADWDTREVRDDVRDYVAEQLGDAGGVLIDRELYLPRSGLRTGTGGPSGSLPCVTTRLHDGAVGLGQRGWPSLTGSYRFWRRYNRAALRPADATMIRPRM